MQTTACYGIPLSKSKPEVQIRLSLNMSCSELLVKQLRLQYAIFDVASSSPPNK